MNENSYETETTMASFSDRLRDEMERQGIIPAELARKTGLSKPTLGAILRGDTSDPRMTSVLSIAKALGCDPLWLFTGKSATEYAAAITINNIPVWELKDIEGQPLDALPLIDTGRHLVTQNGGHLCAVVARDNYLQESGIRVGDICVINMAQSDLKMDAGDIALILHKNRPMLLRVSDSLAGPILVTDDQRFGSIPLKEAILLGKMTELRREN